ncbi:MAG: hypothetical protein QNJ68_05075 [Microcoleaceae cyanobacterium MO_207.B10]|nr:hypothetical protein [Microcoleaceae cyanobacterium MO_207.B10]
MAERTRSHIKDIGHAARYVSLLFTIVVCKYASAHCYTSSDLGQGIRLAITTQRLSGDSWPFNGSSKFSGAVSPWPTCLYMVCAVIDTWFLVYFGSKSGTISD